MRGGGSGPTASREARVEADLADVVPVQQPAQQPLQTQAVAAVRRRAVHTLKPSWVSMSRPQIRASGYALVERHVNASDCMLGVRQ